MAESPAEPVRLDKWLWAARFFKTRSLAAQAIEGGRVQLNGERVKRAKAVEPGDQLRIRQGPFEYHLVVRRVSGRRGPAREAATLFEETAASKATREHLADQLRAQPSIAYEGKGRPTKRDRREIERLRGRED